eukprot:TRINITY_DN7856_c0_g1_i3.p1 TRINITY_DN7856_c0_g1~~TRINITY_DN7856_c0_g1_i3.p1  ORF type:complete len:330 (+),score=77.81 TRINITY_DN7856_c0_g1_i3:444-1433(+)
MKQKLDIYAAEENNHQSPLRLKGKSNGTHRSYSVYEEDQPKKKSFSDFEQQTLFEPFDDIPSEDYIRRFEELNQKLQKAESFIDHLRKEHNDKIEQMTERVERCVQELESRESDMNKDRAEFRRLSLQNTSLHEENAALLKQVATLQDKLKDLESDCRANTKVIAEKESMFKDFYDLMRKKEQECEHLATKLQTLKKYIRELEARLLSFNLEKIGKIVNIPAQILARIDVNNEAIIEIETPSERTTIGSSSVVSVVSSKDSARRIILSFKNKAGVHESITFESEDSANILKSLKHFLEKAKEETNKRKSEDEKYDGDKGLLNQIKTFFA